MTRYQGQEIIDVDDMTLDEWLKLVFNPPEDAIFCNWTFPTEKHRNEYLSKISTYSEAEVQKLLINFLIPTGSLGSDEFSLSSLLMESSERREFLLHFQYFKRLLRHAMDPKNAVPPWEGITWVLDLLPHFPKDALEGLNAFILAHAQILPDGRIFGLHDALEIIQAKYIGIPDSQAEVISFLRNLSSRDFECLVERLYKAMGYTTKLTRASKDGGRDILANRELTAQREHILIECKRYENPVDIKIARALLGVVSAEKVNKGVIATTSRFTRGSKDFAAENPRLELISGDELVRLMNQYLGSKWPLHVDRLIAESQHESSSTK